MTHQALLAGLLSVVLSVGPAAAQLKAVPVLEAPVGSGVSGAGARQTAPSLALDQAPSVLASFSALPAPTPVIAPAPTAAAAVPTASARPTAVALPASALPAAGRAAPEALPATPAEAPGAAPTKGLEGVRERTAEMQGLLGEKNGGASAGVKALGLAGTLFDGARRFAGSLLAIGRAPAGPPTVHLLSKKGGHGVTFTLDRPGNAPVVVKVARRPPRDWTASGESERIDYVAKAYDRAPRVPNFDVMRTARHRFTRDEVAQLRKAMAPWRVDMSGLTLRKIDQVVVVTALAPGVTAAEFKERGGVFTEEDRRTLRAGLEALNEQGYVYEDMKGDNLMVLDDPVAGRGFTLIDTLGTEEIASRFDWAGRERRGFELDPHDRRRVAFQFEGLDSVLRP
ncbi:MAG: hypothetical protein HYZ75_12245 [Elusimicrobia bacterium]|nr:hypothetical protein [Elusimicrobiota bacterium]